MLYLTPHTLGAVEQPQEMCHLVLFALDPHNLPPIKRVEKGNRERLDGGQLKPGLGNVPHFRIDFIDAKLLEQSEDTLGNRQSVAEIFYAP